MKHKRNSVLDSMLTMRSPPRVAVVGGGIAGLTCARELCLRGCEPVLFEADIRLGGRCSSRSTPVGWFDDAAQCIGGATRLASYAVQRPGELAALHRWTVPAPPAEDERNGVWNKDEDEADVSRALTPVGAVGVPSMQALADALARPLDFRLNTPIFQARRLRSQWALTSSTGVIEEDFQALVLALPAPAAIPLAQESSALACALRAVRYRSRWVLLLGSERPVALPGYREFEGSPIERVAAMHSKPGRLASGSQRWFVEADEPWSLQHAQDDAETVADLLLENFRAHADRPVTPNYLVAHQWQHAFVHTPAVTPRGADCLWDGEARLGVCGDSVVASRVDRVHDSGVAMARAVAEGLASRSEFRSRGAPGRTTEQQVEAQL